MATQAREAARQEREQQTAAWMQAFERKTRPGSGPNG